MLAFANVPLMRLSAATRPTKSPTTAVMAVLPPSRSYLLEGSCMCAGEFLQAGDYHRTEAGSVHSITSSEQGRLALVMTSTQNEPAG